MNISDINPLTRLAMRARKKFSKHAPEKTRNINKTPVSYIFLKSNREEEIELLKKKIENIVKINPNIQNPIALLIDKKQYEQLDEFAKERYITKLTSLYCKIIEKMAV